MNSVMLIGWLVLIFVSYRLAVYVLGRLNLL